MARVFGWPGPEDVTVRFRGIDVFRTPARQLLDQMEAMGETVIREPDATVPWLSLGFTREAGHEVPLDTDGEPLCFQAVLVGPTDYYNYRSVTRPEAGRRDLR